jgi:iron complex transport system substrate-binding protein
MFRETRIISCVLILFLVSLVSCISGCRSFTGRVPPQDENTVRIGGKPERIISLTASTTEVLFSLGLGDKIVAVSQNCNYPPEARNKEVVISHYINYEKLVSLKPDLIVVDSNSNFTDPSKLKKLNIPVLLVHSDTFPNLLKSILIIGRATGREEAAEEYARNLEIEMGEIALKARETFAGKKPRVCVVIWNNPLMVAGGDTFINFMVETAGGTNVMNNLRGYPQVNPEMLLVRNPEFIILTKINPEEFTRRRLWKNVEAVKHNHVYDVDPDIFVRPGIRAVTGCELLYELLKGYKPGLKMNDGR